MKSKLLVILFLCAFQSGIVAQLNDYKYIIVPKRFDAFKVVNEFQSSTLIKYLLVQEGFNVIYDDAMPDDLIRNRCLGLITKVKDESSLLWTKASIQMIDCNGQIIFESVEGKSKEKEFQKGYTEALKEACASFKGMNYTYTPKTSTQGAEPLVISFKNDVKSLESDKEVINSGQSSATSQTGENSEPVKEQPRFTVEGEVFYAQPTESGLDLLDSDSRLKYILEETSVKDVYLINHEGTKGIVFKKDDKWFVEYKVNDNRVKEEMQIKF
ncbi:MAG: hypothetical protein KJO73_00880 [Croceitalea sp.]|nr:hypothetical protein [Croceitalea sp.]